MEVLDPPRLDQRAVHRAQPGEDAVHVLVEDRHHQRGGRERIRNRDLLAAEIEAVASAQAHAEPREHGPEAEAHAGEEHREERDQRALEQREPAAVEHVDHQPGGERRRREHQQRQHQPPPPRRGRVRAVESIVVVAALAHPWLAPLSAMTSHQHQAEHAEREAQPALRAGSSPAGPARAAPAATPSRRAQSPESSGCARSASGSAAPPERGSRSSNASGRLRGPVREPEHEPPGDGRLVRARARRRSSRAARRGSAASPPSRGRSRLPGACSRRASAPCARGRRPGSPRAGPRLRCHARAGRRPPRGGRSVAAGDRSSRRSARSAVSSGGPSVAPGLRQNATLGREKAAQLDRLVRVFAGESECDAPTAREFVSLGHDVARPPRRGSR